MTDGRSIPRTPVPDAEPGWKLRLEDRLGLLDPIQLLIYRSIGTPDLLHVRGRVLERKNVEGVAEETHFVQNVVNALRRMDSDEIPGAAVRGHFRGETFETATDEEGYFVIDIRPPEPLSPGWHEVEVELVDSVGNPERRRATEGVMVPSPDARFAIVSDLDDTVIKTRSTELLQQLAIIFGKGARSRTVLPGISPFYQRLVGNQGDSANNPIYYVSLSGWNLYDLFDEFMAANDLPQGPLFLSDFRLIEDKSPVLGRDHHKFESIDLLLRTYPDLPFVLIGDSGMEDPELYREIAEKHPDRVKAIYIHDVSPDGRDDEVAEIGESLGKKGIPLITFETVDQAAEHAVEQGLITEDDLKAVREAMEEAQGW